MSIQKLKKWSPTQQQRLTRRSVLVDGLTVEIEQDVVSNQAGEANINRGRPASSEVGKVLWPEYLHFIKADWCSVDVLELGCGPGLCGIYLGLLGASCVLTDLDDVVKLTKRNIDLNFFTSETVVDQGNIPLTIGYDWCSEEQHISELLRKSFEVIVAADVLYEPCNFEALLQVIDRHSTTTTRVYIGFQIRTGTEFEYCQENLTAMGFNVGLVETDNLPPRWRNPHTRRKLEIIYAYRKQQVE